MPLHETREAEASLREALKTREALAKAREANDRAYLRYLRDARRAHWPWTKIGGLLGVSEVAVRRHWERNRQKADRMGASNVEANPNGTGSKTG